MNGSAKPANGHASAGQGSLG